MKLIYRYKGENEIFLTEPYNKNCANSSMHSVIRFNMAYVIINKEIKKFLLIISKVAKNDLCQNGSTVTIMSLPRTLETLQSSIFLRRK